MGEFDRIASVQFDQTNGAVSGIGDVLIDLGNSLDETSAKVVTLLSAPTVPNIIIPNDTPAANDSGEGEDSEEEQAASFRERWHQSQLESEKEFQEKWTFFQETGTKNRLKLLYLETTDSLGILAQHSRTMFELNRAVGLANATVFIATGISRALELPFPANLAAAATVALEGAAQIKTITSAEYGKGDVTQPGTSATATTNVDSANSGLAANDPAIADIGQSEGPSILFYGFHTPGASEEQRADEQARLLQIAEDNDLLTRDSNGRFVYNGSGTSNYEPLNLSEAV